MPGEPDEVGHILVVDDDVMVRQTITNYLEEHMCRRLPCRPGRT
jgi:two-component system OmpR family response regulator